MIRRTTVWIMAIGCGVSVANLYYNQPLLAQMAADFKTTEGRMGLVSALSQVGYALGLLFIVPLGDRVERRGLVVGMLLAVSVTLVATALARDIPWLAVATLLVGFTTVTPQILVPFAAGLAAPGERGKVVGTVMSGLLIGILLSRTASGVVGAHLGWRAVYLIAAGLMVCLALVLGLLLPRGEPGAAGLSYPQLLSSLVDLTRREPVLRESCVYGALAFGAFSAFWNTLAFFLAGPPYHYGSAVTGLFGLVGVAGALTASGAGWASDRISPRFTIAVGLGVTLLAFVLFGLAGTHLLGLVIGVVLLDLGVQACHISNQARIYRLRPETHSRLNTVYMVSYFAGGAAGSALGAYGWSGWGWPGVCAAGALLVLVAGAFFLATARLRQPSGQWSSRPD